MLHRVVPATQFQSPVSSLSAPLSKRVILRATVRVQLLASSIVLELFRVSIQARMQTNWLQTRLVTRNAVPVTTETMTNSQKKNQFGVHAKQGQT